MLSIARALMLNPTLLLLDEPSEGLAPMIVQEIIEVLKGLKGEASPSCWSSRTCAPRSPSPTVITS